MLELLMNARSGKYYPDSGPGPKVLLAGNTTAGFFGFATDEELSDLSERVWGAITRTPSFAQTSAFQNRGIVWSKLFVDGDVYYVPNMPVASNVPVRTSLEAGIFSRIPKNIHFGSSAQNSNLIGKQGRIFSVREGNTTHAVSVAAPSSNTDPLSSPWSTLYFDADPEIRALYMAFGGINLPVVNDKAFVRHTAPISGFNIFFGNVSNPGNVSTPEAYGLITAVSYRTMYVNSAQAPSNEKLTLSTMLWNSSIESLTYLPVVKLEPDVVDIPLEEIYPLDVKITTSFTAQYLGEVSEDSIHQSVVKTIVADEDSPSIHGFDLDIEIPQLAIVSRTDALTSNSPKSLSEASQAVVTSVATVNAAEPSTVLLEDSGLIVPYVYSFDTHSPSDISIESGGELRLTKPVIVSVDALPTPAIVFEKV